MVKGYVSMVLHSHLPFVRHPEVKDALEEKWLFEAMMECYIPLINVYDEIIKDNIKFRITMSITPPLMSMLEDQYLNERFLEYLIKSIELSEKEIERTKDQGEINKTARFYNSRFKKFLQIYNSYDKRLMNAFKKFANLGVLEIITSAATHGLLPLLMVNKEAVRAQLKIGVDSYIEHMGFTPKGIWLPECAYTYDLDGMLKELGIEYFIIESVGIENGSPKPRYGTATPISTPSGVCAFGRDSESGHQVWSSYMGFPGDVNYREFYRDIGYELPIEYIGDYIHESGIRIDTGFKYYRITGKSQHKEPYNRKWAMERVENNATHFAHCRNTQILELSEQMDVPPIITCPYDTELFGHWWFEGPDFIDKFIRKSSENWNEYELITPSEYLKKYPMVQCSSPSPSSWGKDSDYSVWLNPLNDWIYRDVHACETAMTTLANTYKDPNNIQKRALNQAARELLLAESSDWPFIINGNTTVKYATKRVNTHIERFYRLYDDITKNCLEKKFLEHLEELDNIFPNIDYKIYSN